MKSEDKGIPINSKIEFSLEVDGLDCPLPLLRLKKFLSRLASGQSVTVTGITFEQLPMMEEWCARSGHTLSDTVQFKRGISRVSIRKA